MTASYRLIDYSLRPAKFAERRMLSEMFSRLKVFGSLESYRYIGFGSIWFTDCVLFHRALGPVPLLCRPKCSFKPLSVRKRRGFSNPMLNGGGADCKSRLCI